VTPDLSDAPEDINLPVLITMPTTESVPQLLIHTPPEALDPVELAENLLAPKTLSPSEETPDFPPDIPLFATLLTTNPSLLPSMPVTGQVTPVESSPTVEPLSTTPS